MAAHEAPKQRMKHTVKTQAKLLQQSLRGEHVADAGQKSDSAAEEPVAARHDGDDRSTRERARSLQRENDLACAQCRAREDTIPIGQTAGAPAKPR